MGGSMSTLIEKLEEYHNGLYEKLYDNHKHPYDEGAMDAVEKAINIVKQHSDWIAVGERLPPDNMMVLVYCRIRKTAGYAFVSHQQAWSFYHFTKNSENQALAMVNDISKWMPIPQLPSEVQP